MNMLIAEPWELAVPETTLPVSWALSSKEQTGYAHGEWKGTCHSEDGIFLASELCFSQRNPELSPHYPFGDIGILGHAWMAEGNPSFHTL